MIQRTTRPHGCRHPIRHAPVAPGEARDRAPRYDAAVSALLSDRDLLAKLVAFDSSSRNSNLPIAEFVCTYLDRPGVRVERIAGGEASKLNVVAVAGPEVDASRRGLVLAGHLDTVPAEAAGWSSEPFTLTERDGRLHGRGACDMKGFIALAMNLLASTDPAALHAPLALLLTCDEELGSLGAQALAARGALPRPLPRSCVVGEPTSLRAVRMHKGHLKLRVVHRGRTAHSGMPHLGVNAIDAAARAVVALSRFTQQLAARRTEVSRYFPTAPYPVLNVAAISGGAPGGAANVVPDRCETTLGIRLLPGMNSSAMIGWIRDVLSQSEPAARFEIETLNDNPPMLLEESAPVHRALCDMLGQRDSVGVSFASDAGVLQQRLGMECVLFGPGSMDHAHQPDEFVPARELDRARALLSALIDRFCAAPRRS
jgi:acetylornithine deacetylase